METVNEGVRGKFLESDPSTDVLTLAPPRTANTSKRLIAFGIDAVVALILWQVPIAGKLLGLSYILLRDGFKFKFLRGRSIGKKLMGLKPVRLKNQPMDMRTSLRRNWVFVIAGFASLLRWVPLIGWLIVLVGVILGILAGLYEIYLVVNERNGRRWGDVFAGTRVVETTE